MYDHMYNRMYKNYKMQQRIRHFITNRVKPTAVILCCVGGWIGGMFGLGIGHRKITIFYGNNKNRKEHVIFSGSIPLITGVVGAVLFPLITAMSPFIVFEYMCSGLVVDKVIDKVYATYNITRTRYHQYGHPKYGKYYAPSNLEYNIEQKTAVDQPDAPDTKHP